ncbi:hypothetical protein ACFU8I_10615 [Streptomyces sp. NPDC057540]|uniref:hypothetical protein n=1 Tax=Streptomyces sp. NPDC057540 TaxID=3346160 RepID=UPI0036C4F2A1
MKPFRAPPAPRVSTLLRASLLLVLALLCADLPLTPESSPAHLQRPCAQHAAPTAALDPPRASDGGADIAGGSLLHRDRRRPVTTTAGLPGPPPVTRTAALAAPPAGRPGDADTRPRPLAAHDSSTLQVFRC